MTRHFVVLGIGCFCQAAFSDCTAGDPGQASALPAWGKGGCPERWAERGAMSAGPGAGRAGCSGRSRVTPGGRQQAEKGAFDGGALGLTALPPGRHTKGLFALALQGRVALVPNYPPRFGDACQTPVRFIIGMFVSGKHSKFSCWGFQGMRISSAGKGIKHQVPFFACKVQRLAAPSVGWLCFLLRDCL